MLLIILNAIAILNLLLFIGVLMVKRYRTRANKLLAFIIINAILTMILNLTMYYQLLDDFPVILYIAYLFEFLWAPFLYYYIHLLIHKEIVFTPNKLSHFILFIGMCIFFIWFGFQPGYYREDMIIRLQTNKIPVQFLVINYLSVLQFMIFLIASYFAVKNHEKRDGKVNITTEWLQKFIPRAFILCIIMYIPITLSTGLKLYLILIPAASLVLYFYMVFKAIDSPLVNSEKSVQIVNETKNITIDNSKITTKLSGQNVQELKNKLEESFLQTKLFLDKNIKMQTLAEICNTKVHILSAFINEHYNKSFFDFINFYRIEEAKKMLSDPKKQKYSIDTIAEKSGFSSRSAFYKAFKKYTDLTPREYIKSEC